MLPVSQSEARGIPNTFKTRQAFQCITETGTIKTERKGGKLTCAKSLRHPTGFNANVALKIYSDSLNQYTHMYLDPQGLLLQESNLYFFVFLFLL